MRWPGGKSFAFTIFDDPDSQILASCRRVYDFLTDSGLRTTVGVWPCAPIREANSPGETCASAAYRTYIQELQGRGFEVGYHNTTAHSSPRPEIARGLDVFGGYFGDSAITMANHYNAEAIYWGQSRLSGIRRTIYQAATLGRTTGAFSGHIEGSPYYWGDLCKQRVRYCRSFAYSMTNTLRACPWTPYHDPDRGLVNYWYASSDGANKERFLQILSEPKQDELEAEGGACIMYTHFGHGFVEDGVLDARFQSLIERLSRKNGWFVPVSTLLDYLLSERGDPVITQAQRKTIEWRWLTRKLVSGTS
jgi:hypothetical protein